MKIILLAIAASFFVGCSGDCRLSCDCETADGVKYTLDHVFEDIYDKDGCEQAADFYSDSECDCGTAWKKNP